MSQTAKAQEPSMEEILASIRRIIADDDAGKPTKAPEPLAPKPAAAPPPPPLPAAAVPARPAPPPPPPPAAANKQSDIDAMLADLDKPKPAPMAAPVKPAAPPAGDVLDLTEEMAAAAAAADVARTGADVPHHRRRLRRGVRRPPRWTRRARKSRAVRSRKRRCPIPGSCRTPPPRRSTARSIRLPHTVLGQNARTLEDLVKEMLRPMLKSWLDDNLPGLVERIVRAEIERVSRGKP